mmetsp:Transcript_14780/g.55714  ORF Transcript_14780/g.55714 Transcript_14780/m.55714 type:complete len:324 (-) Transcript_14780:1418-2389(-)
MQNSQSTLSRSRWFCGTRPPLRLCRKCRAGTPSARQACSVLDGRPAAGCAPRSPRRRGSLLNSASPAAANRADWPPPRPDSVTTACWLRTGMRPKKNFPDSARRRQAGPCGRAPPRAPRPGRAASARAGSCLLAALHDCGRLPPAQPPVAAPLGQPPERASSRGARAGGQAALPAPAPRTCQHRAERAPPRPRSTGPRATSPEGTKKPRSSRQMTGQTYTLRRPCRHFPLPLGSGKPPEFQDAGLCRLCSLRRCGRSRRGRRLAQRGGPRGLVVHYGGVRPRRAQQPHHPLHRGRRHRPRHLAGVPARARLGRGEGLRLGAQD